MDIFITATQKFKETPEEFFNFPEEPTADPDKELQEDYAIGYISPKIFQKLISPSQPNLLIKTFHGQIIVKPEIDEHIDERICLMALSPWTFMLTPISIQTEEIEENLDENRYLFDQIVDRKEKEEKEKEKEEPDNIPAITPKYQFDFTATSSFKAEIEATALAITTYQNILDKFFNIEIEPNEEFDHEIDEDEDEDDDDDDDDEELQ